MTAVKVRRVFMSSAIFVCRKKWVKEFVKFSAKKLMKQNLNFEQKQRRVEVTQESLNEVKDDAELLKRVITGDATWVYGYDIETNAQLSQ